MVEDMRPQAVQNCSVDTQGGEELPAFCHLSTELSMLIGCYCQALCSVGVKHIV